MLPAGRIGQGRSREKGGRNLSGMRTGNKRRVEGEGKKPRSVRAGSVTYDMKKRGKKKIEREKASLLSRTHLSSAGCTGRR